MLVWQLIYLLILFIPIQLGAHFFFDFSKIAGINSDYLTPTIYLTDIIILILILFDIRKRKLEISKSTFIFLALCIFSVAFTAANKWVSSYKLLKIVEFLWLFKIIVSTRLNSKTIITVYSFSVIYTSILAIFQFMFQKSLGGIFWYLGERTFNASTPGIALGNFNGSLFLRPYATFAHPNIMGGFLALGLPLIFWFLLTVGKLPAKHKTKNMNLIFAISFVLGIIALILTYSRASWLVFAIGIILVMLTEFKAGINFIVGNKKNYFPIFISLFIASIILPHSISTYMKYSQGSLFERQQLIVASLMTIKDHPVAGIGLNNSIIYQYQLMPTRFGAFIIQPVHNAYLLIMAEHGVTGFIFVLVFIKKIFEKINKENAHRLIPFFLIIILGFFDHYLITLQQGNLISVLFTSLVFSSQKT